MAEDSSSMLDGGAMVWVPHDDQVWKRAVVLRRLDDGVQAEVRLESNDGEYHKDDGLVKLVNIAEIARQAGTCMSSRLLPEGESMGAATHSFSPLLVCLLFL